MTKRILVLITFLFISGKEYSQNVVFTFGEFLEIVFTDHPMAKSAGLLSDVATQTIREARGEFDPVIQFSHREKTFDNTEYYAQAIGMLKVPTWFGVTGFAGVVNAEGNYLNPEYVTPQGGLAQAGVELSLGQGLFFDKRRAALAKSKIYSEATLAQRRILLLELLSECTESYWNWAAAWEQWQIYESALSLAKIRFEGVKNSHAAGDRPAIDTLEAFLQVQARQFSRNEYELKFTKATFELNTYLWNQSGQPLEISQGLIPQPIDSLLNTPLTATVALPDSLEITHPVSRQYALKVKQLEIEKRLAIEQIKPKLGLKLSVLTPVENTTYTNSFEFQSRNYAVGVDFSMPILLRRERAQLSLTKLYLQQAHFAQNSKQLEILNKAKSVQAELRTAVVQIELFKDYVRNFQFLLDAELIRLETGESSLFLVNAREVNVIDARIKLVALTATYPALRAKLILASGDWDGTSADPVPKLPLE
jgi:outer membrane protein TolC